MRCFFVVIPTFVSHNQEFLYGPRNFSSVDDMDEAIIERWNSVVKPNDMVIHLGDVMLNDNIKGINCLKRLNGQISLIFGNHDTDTRQHLIWTECPNIITLGYAHRFKYEKLSIYLSHYPTLTANYDEKHFSEHTICLHGHTHQMKNWLDPENPFLYHVGVDSHNCTPVHIDEIIADIRNKWNELGTLKFEKRPLYNYPM